MLFFCFFFIEKVSNAELSPVLPPAVLSILTDNDSEEMMQEEKTHSSYSKMVEAVSCLYFNSILVEFQTFQLDLHVALPLEICKIFVAAG